MTKKVNIGDVLTYGLVLALFLILLKWLEYRLYFVMQSTELLVGSVSVVFMGLGIWLALKLRKPAIIEKELIIERPVVIEKEVIVEKEIIVKETVNEFQQDKEQIDKLGLSSRELEVLELMAAGMSNHEIADKLCLSVSTIKSHSSSLFEKLDVKRRTQAVDLAKRLSIIP